MDTLGLIVLLAWLVPVVVVALGLILAWLDR